MAIAIEGDNAEEILHNYWSYYNYGATNDPEPMHLGAPERFVYFITQSDRLFRAMVSRELVALMGGHTIEYKGVKRGFYCEAGARAQRFIDSIENENFLHYGHDTLTAHEINDLVFA